MLKTIEHGPIRELNLNRAPANAMNPELIRAIKAAVQQAPDQGAQALVLSGREGIYSAGLDVPELLTLDRAGIEQTWRDFFSMLETVAGSPIPVVAAITGHSPAGGAVLSLYTDHRIMAEGDYRIGLNEVQVGLPLPEVIYTALRYHVGPRQAERLGTFGALISPSEAWDVGLVDEVVPMRQVVPRAVAWCEKLLKLPPAARIETRALARRDLVGAFDTFTDETLQTFSDRWFTPETQAAMKALVARLAK